ncbi:DUF6265 family protein [Algoriphagus sp. A40]|uniref:DUF6265 family protein n=1 Tax=Algoriphagus sp. A40 TaxID=1945863 RepID=UPI000987C4F4|nr:DUF6265 family protein [Algoriphagus sp. A40]OOG76195.1 hypothetical protein B0E43_09145 [Algoriphagus sp. A40]
MSIKHILLLIGFLITGATSAQQPISMIWMEGVWKIETGRGQIVETWKILNDSTLTGESRFVTTSGESMLQERLELSRRNGVWAYTSTVEGQNNNQPVSFKVIFARGTEFISENPAHDFPQRISYRRVEDRIFASIEGRKNDNYNKQNFDFKKD